MSEFKSIKDYPKLSLKYRYITTVNGIDFDTAKSALQKYIRRGNIDKAIYIAKELDLFRFFEGGQSSWTNFYNRLRVIVLEDIGLGADIVTIDFMFNEWIQEKSKNIESKILPILISYLCLSEHTRFYSHVTSNYNPKFLETEPPYNMPEFKYNLGKNSKIRTYVDGLISCIENRDNSVVYWINKILEENLYEKVNRKNRPGFLIFDILRKMFPNNKKLNKVINICEKWYDTLKVREQFLCIYHPIFYLLFNKNNFFEIDIVSSKIKKLIEFNIDDYCYDKHTKQGKKLSRNTADFAIEGSLVAYEIDVDRKLKDNYIKNRLSNEEISSEREEFKFKARTQLVTAEFKTDVYFAKNKIGQNVVVKGPYLKLDDVMKPFEIMNILKLIREINTFDINIKYLKTNMFEGTPLGIRKRIKLNEPAYFVVMEDLIGLDEYPIIEKSSKLWNQTKVADFNKVFENNNYGYGIPSEMSDEALLSFYFQIAVRYIFSIGDFASRNFLRKGNKVYNLDIEGVHIGRNIRMKNSEKQMMIKFIDDNNEKIDKVLNKWINNDLVDFYSNKIGISFKEEVKVLIENPKIMFE